MTDAEMLGKMIRLGDLETAVDTSISEADERAYLVTLAKTVAHEIEGHRCQKCLMSTLNTGQIAALVLRLTDIMDRIKELPRLDDAEMSPLDEIRSRR